MLVCTNAERVVKNHLLEALANEDSTSRSEGDGANLLRHFPARVVKAERR